MWIGLRAVDPATSEALNVNCFTKTLRPWMKATHRQRATVRGVKRSKYAFDIKLVDAEILRVEGDPVPEFSAKELPQHLADSNSNELKHLFITGTVSEVEASEGSPTRLHLEVEGTSQVVCTLLPFLESDTYQAGRQVRFLAIIGEVTEDRVKLAYCLPAEMEASEIE